MDRTAARPRAVRRIAGAAIGVLGVCGVVVAASGAGAAEHKVTLCHATDSTTNPYSVVTVDYHSITHQGHGSHEGPVYAPGIEGKWGDVIPAFDFGSGNAYAGMNLDASGQALLDNGCATTPVESTTTTLIG